jgi:hypothetical protein
MRVAAVAPGWRSPAGLALLVGLGGFFIAGPVGGMIGLPAGVVAFLRTRVVLLAAVLALATAAVFTVIEEPLTTASIPGFPNDHPLAELAAKVAAVLLLGGLAGIVARHDRAVASRVLTRDPETRAGNGTLGKRVPSSTIAAVLIVSLLGALTLWQLGDRRWEAVALPVMIAVLILGSVVVTQRR